VGGWTSPRSSKIWVISYLTRLTWRSIEETVDKQRARRLTAWRRPDLDLSTIMILPTRQLLMILYGWEPCGIRFG
jgi:hypothetical protein